MAGKIELKKKKKFGDKKTQSFDKSKSNFVAPAKQPDNVKSSKNRTKEAADRREAGVTERLRKDRTKGRSFSIDGVKLNRRQYEVATGKVSSTPEERDTVNALLESDKLVKEKEELEGDEVQVTDELRGLQEQGLVGLQGESLEEFGQRQFDITTETIARAEGRKPLGEMMAYQQGLLAIATMGTSGLGRLAGVGRATSTEAAIAEGMAQQSAVEKGFQVGTKAKTPTTTAGRYASNGKSWGKTMNFMTSAVAISIGAAGLLISAIGSYPFAGFIKEEALQTLSLGFNSAKDDLNIEGMRQSLELQKEILEGRHKVLSKIPYANTWAELQSFYDAAQIKMEIDEQTFLQLIGELGQAETQPTITEDVGSEEATTL